MARDYANRADRRGGRGKRRNRPAAKRRDRRGGLPRWLWIFCALCVGITVAAGFYVFGRPVDGGRVEIAGVPGGIEVPGKQQSEPAEGKPPKARFAFYELLPNYEVVLPPGAAEPVPAEPPPATAPAAHSSAPTQPPAHTTARPDSAPRPVARHDTPGGRFVVQAGSFASYADADEHKAKLALLGVITGIHKVTLESGKTYFRVRTPPVRKGESLDYILGLLEEHQIPTLVVAYDGS